VTTRYHARWVLPVSAPPIADAAVVARDGRIAYVGPRADAPRSADDEEIDLGDALLLPGLVNAHCHLELTAMRGFLDGLDFRSWLLRLTHARSAVLDDEAFLDASRLGIEEGLRAGVTTFADTGDSGTGFDAMLERGVRGICYREVFGPDPAQCAGAIAGLRVGFPAWRAREPPVGRAGGSPPAPNRVTDVLSRPTPAPPRAPAPTPPTSRAAMRPGASPPPTTASRVVIFSTARALRKASPDICSSDTSHFSTA
jgi:5-methylthioadenosine/S-adenosylhomocysteine deaminase